MSESLSRLAAESRASRIRYRVVAAAMLMAVLLYLDRFCVAFALPYIADDLKLTGQQQGMYLSAFFLFYALAQVPSGWLSDRHGARRMLTIYILTWSLFTAWMGLVQGFIMLLVMRIGIGLGQAGAYPTSANLVSKWVPFSGRGAASSVIALGGRFGGFIAPIATAYLIVAFVPVSQPSLIEPDNVKNGAALAYHMVHGEEQDDTKRPPKRDAAGKIIGARIVGQLHEALRDSVIDAAGQYRRWLENGKPEDGRPEMPLALHDRFAEALREIQTQREFAKPTDFDALKKVEREALLLMARPREALSEPEVHRLNRLLFEAVYPGDFERIYMAGWRPVLLIYGAAGLLVALLFWRVVRNRPADHPRVNAAELNLIESGRPAGAPDPHGEARNIPWGPLLKSGSMWLMCLSQFGTNIGWLFLVSWLPTYLLEVHEVPIVMRGWMCGLPLAAGWVGMLIGGKITDWVAGRLGLRWGRALPLSLSRFVGMAAYLSLLRPGVTPWEATAAFCVVAFATDMGTPCSWAFKQDVGGPYVASVLGWANMWGNLGATVSPYLLKWVWTEFGYEKMFLTCAAAFLVSGLAALGVNAAKPIAPKEDGENEPTSASNSSPAKS